MRRDMRRPPSMPIRTFVNHLLRINDNELPFLPPFGQNQALNEDELKEIIYYGLPPKWKDDMIKLNFDCFMQPFEEVVNFCERQESTAENQAAAKKATQDTELVVVNTKMNSNNSMMTIKNNRQRNNRKRGPWCEYHKDNTHYTNQCRTLQQLHAAKKATNAGKPNAKPSNRGWKRKAPPSSSNAKQAGGDMQVILACSQNAVKRAKHEVNMLTQALDAATQKIQPKVGETDSDTTPTELHAMNTFLGSINEVQNNSSESDIRLPTDEQVRASPIHIILVVVLNVHVNLIVMTLRLLMRQLTNVWTQLYLRKPLV